MDRRSALVVLGVVAIGLAAGALYVVAASDRYEARGELLVTPAPSESALGGIGLLEDSDESAAADTAARIVDSARRETMLGEVFVPVSELIRPLLGDLGA